MTSHVLYNGATGGLGRHLGAALADQNLSPWPIRSRLGDTTGLTAELDDLPIEHGSSLTFIQSAGMVSIIECEENPAETYDVNVSRTTVTVETFVKWSIANGSTPGILFISSGHVYAPPPQGNRLDESSPVEPRSVYARTELEGENRMRTLSAEHDLGLAICRVFGMIGPDQRHHYLLPGLIRRIRTGDLAAIPGLDYVRDYLDTRDVSRLLASLTAHLFGTDNERRVSLVNVCSGEEIRIGDLVDELIALFYEDDPEGAQKAREAVGTAPGRPTDVTWSVGDPSLLTTLVTDPIRSIPITDTLADALATGPK